MTGYSITIKKSDFLLVLVFLFVMLACAIKDINILFTLSLASFFIVLFLALRDSKKNIVLCAFLIALFTFLYGSPVATLLLGSTYDVHFPSDAKIHFYLTLLLSTSFLGLGYSIPAKVRLSKIANETRDSLRVSLRQISKLIFYFTYSLKIIQYLEIGYYVLQHGYMYFYTDYSSSIPLLVEKIADLYIVALSIYLATNPSKEDRKPVLILFLFGGLLSILTGKRYEFVYVLMLYLIFIVFSDYNQSTNGSLFDRKTKRTILLMLVGIPVLIVFLMFVGATRSKYQFEFTSVFSIILDFMVDIGNSGKVIMRGFLYKDVIPTDRFYSFGGLIEYFKYNIFSVKVLGVTVPNPRTYEYVQTGHIFSYAITYYFSASSFYSGHGQGSSYIAELFADFGYVGVVLGSFGLGVFIRQFFSFSGKSVLHDAILFFLVRSLLFIPRDTFCLPLTNLINFKYISAFILIYLIAQYFENKRPITGGNSI